MTINIVQKYNGKSLDSIEKIQAVARHIAETKNEYEGIVVVASAMGDTTENLLELANQVGTNIPKRELDVLLSSGEQQIVALLTIALQNLGIEAESMIGCNSGTIKNRHITATEVKEINTDRVEEIIKGGKVAIVAGFQGVDEFAYQNKRKRGGSDITAVAIAAHLGWECEIYSSSECMYTADPDMYEGAKQIQAITYEEMMEIANLGADKIETRAIELAKKYNVKLFLGKSLEKDKSRGTYIMSKEMIINENLLVDDMPITGMGIQDEVAIFTFRNLPADGVAVAECFRILAELEINVDMISQQMAENGTCTVSFSCSSEQGEALMAALENQEAFSGVDISSEGDLAMISLVGVGMATHSGVASKVFQVLAENQIRYYHITTSEISISVTVEMDQKLKAAIAFCRAFQL